MRLTIVVSDKTVGKDGVFYSDLALDQCGIPDGVHAMQWSTDVGFIEFDGHREPEEKITELPNWATACLALWQVAHDEKTKPKPEETLEEKLLMVKGTANGLLYQSDFAMLPDVNISNKADWEIYRAALRTIARNPTIDPVWPVRPPSLWV
jgi:hypothetical protein